MHSYWFIIAVNSAFDLAFAIWILHAHVGAVPVEIDEAAMLDGLGRFRIMVRMILPLTAGIAVPDAVRALATTPAAALGLAAVGAIRPGLDADLVVLEPDLAVHRVMANGRWTERH